MSTSAEYLSEPADLRQPATARVLAQIVSIVFHPLFIPVYLTAFLLFVHPLMFAGYDDGRKLRLLATVIVNLSFLPLVTVFLSWRLGFLGGMFLRTQRERIIPLAAAMIFYFWCWYVLRNITDIPVVFRDFLFGTFLTIIAGWLLNIMHKVSLHALAAGGMAGFMLILLLRTEGGSAWYIAAAVVIAGVVGSSRLITGSHRPAEVYVGLIVGALCQMVAVVV
jgi:hypothetical protein